MPGSATGLFHSGLPARIVVTRWRGTWRLRRNSLSPGQHAGHSVARPQAGKTADLQRVSKAVRAPNAITSFVVFIFPCWVQSRIQITPAGRGSPWGITLPGSRSRIPRRTPPLHRLRFRFRAGRQPPGRRTGVVSNPTTASPGDLLRVRGARETRRRRRARGR
jgi:hypothetical protein